MIQRLGQVTDDTTAKNPIPGASVYVYNIDGTDATLTSDGTTPLSVPLVTDAFGNYSYYAAVGYYREDTWFAGKLRFRENNIALGSPGADLNLRTDLVANTGSTLVNWLRSATGAVARLLSSKLGDITNVKDFGAAVDGTTDDTTAVASAATAGPFEVRGGTLKTATAPSIFTSYAYRATFSGAAALDSPYPAFGPAAFRVIEKGSGLNCIVGIAHNTASANTNIQPCGITAYGRGSSNGGNVIFGGFVRADLYAATGVATNEANSFNYGAAPSASLPPDRSIGTAQCHPIAWTVAAGGSFNSSIGIQICREGSSPQSFLTAFYVASDAAVSYGVFVDAVAASAQTAAVLKHGVGAVGLHLEAVGTPNTANSVIEVKGGGGAIEYTVKQGGVVHSQGALSASGGIGYETGAGGAVTQLTSKATAVTLNKTCGAITLNNAALAATTVVTFTLNNSLIAADDDVRVWVKSGNASAGSYRVAVEGNGAGSRTIVIENKTAGSLSEALVVGFNLIKAVVS